MQKLLENVIMGSMEDMDKTKTYLIKVNGKNYATGALTQWEAEITFQEQILHDLDNTDYEIREVDLDDIKNNKTVEFF